MLSQLTFNPNAAMGPQQLAPGLVPVGFTGEMNPRTGTVGLKRETVGHDDKGKPQKRVQKLGGQYDGTNLILESIGAPHGMGVDTFDAWVQFARLTKKSERCFFDLRNRSLEMQPLFDGLLSRQRIRHEPSAVAGRPALYRILG